MSTTGYETVLVERIGLVERITLNRPEKLNALNTLLQDELIDPVHAAERSNEVRVIVIRGAGRAFCAGYDINPGREEAATVRPKTFEQDVALTISYGQRWANLWNCRIPVIAQVHGWCIAGGSDIALHCDMVIAADDAKIGFPPVRAQGAPPTHMWLYHLGP
jgi:enoyl-CoA hydratase